MNAVLNIPDSNSLPGERSSSQNGSMQDFTHISVGDFIIVRVNEAEVSPDLADFLEEVRPIGVHFGKEAFLQEVQYDEWLDHFALLKRQIQTHCNRKKMIFALDHEGGRVHRVPPPLTQFSYPLNWGTMSRRVGKCFGEQLSSLGINVLFGPCLDIFSNEENTVIGPRSFGKNPYEVDEFSSAFIQEVEKHDVLVTLKHFPGHGDTTQDSHFELPILTKSQEALWSEELIPFQLAINGGAQAVMLAHILFPEIDSNFPASLSHALALNLLREELGFSGVSFTDDLDMKAIHNRFTPEQIAQQVVSSEINFTIFNHNFDHARAVAQALEELLKENPPEISRTQHRTQKFLASIGNLEVSRLSPKTLEKHNSLLESLPEMFEISVKEFTGD